MNDKSAGASLPRAKIKKARPAWLLWLVPLGAAGLCVWFVYRDFVATGPALTIYFANAAGLDEGNTPINYRGAQIGIVKHLELTPDHQSVKVNARLIGSAKDLARGGTVFWIVRPEFKVGAISGLRTIISGEYITLQPGTGPPTNSFLGADKAPVPPELKALHVTLLSPTLNSLQEQSPILYRGIQVGRVQSYQLADNAQDVVIQATITQEYAPLVRANTKFWNVGGINFKFSLFRGAEIWAESPETLVGGGIELATPPELQPAATDGAIFRLYEKAEPAWSDWQPDIPVQVPARAGPTVAPNSHRGLK
jgi:paraquat-inducible protein B